MLSAEQTARIDRLAGIVGEHTRHVLAVVVAWQRGLLTAQQRDEQMRQRFSRTVVALLGAAHPDGPP